MKKGKANAHKFIRKEETIKKKIQYGEIINCKYTADFGNYLIYLWHLNWFGHEKQGDL